MIIFPGGERLKWNFRRGGGSILGADFGKSREGGGVIRKIPSVGGMDIFWNHTIQAYFVDTSDKYSPDLWIVSRQLPSWMRECEGAGASYVIRQPTPLQGHASFSTFCAFPLKLQAIH